MGKFKELLLERDIEDFETNDSYEDDTDEDFGHENKIEIECSEMAARQLTPLLRELKYMGDVGASRGIKIENYDHDDSFGFDGDGSSKIGSLKVNGQEIEFED